MQKFTTFNNMDKEKIKLLYRKTRNMREKLSETEEELANHCFEITKERGYIDIVTGKGVCFVTPLKVYSFDNLMAL